MPEEYRNPVPTVDIIIELASHPGKILLIQRKNPPLGYALPGGFVDEGELWEVAALREAKEETGLDIELLDLLYVYSNPNRDPRQHTVSAVYTAKCSGFPEAGDDATDVIIADPTDTPLPLVFDHSEIIQDYIHFRKTGARPLPATMLDRHAPR